LMGLCARGFSVFKVNMACYAAFRVIGLGIGFV